LIVLVLLGLIGAVLFGGGVLRLPERGAVYPRLAHDHDELMVSATGRAERTVTVMFVGNSLTFVNDLPAMLVNLASSDPGNPVRLQVKGETVPNATLDYIRTHTGALAWAQAHHPDLVVLQEHSFWYDNGYEAASWSAEQWKHDLRPLGAKPLLFEVWADGDGSALYTNKAYAAYAAATPAGETGKAAENTKRLGRELGLDVVEVGDAFQAAREIPGAPDVLGPDHHHPSVAGTYLAALVFYRRLTERSGADATYLPRGLSREDAAALLRASGG
jgi:hypothetical protein